MKKKAYDGLLLDAGGTLLQLSEPVEQTYAKIGLKYGMSSILLGLFFSTYEFQWSIQNSIGCAEESILHNVYNVYNSIIIFTTIHRLMSHLLFKHYLHFTLYSYLILK